MGDRVRHPRWEGAPGSGQVSGCRPSGSDSTCPPYRRPRRGTCTCTSSTPPPARQIFSPQSELPKIHTRSGLPRHPDLQRAFRCLAPPLAPQSRRGSASHGPKASLQNDSAPLRLRQFHARHVPIYVQATVRAKVPSNHRRSRLSEGGSSPL